MPHNERINEKCVRERRKIEREREKEREREGDKMRHKNPDMRRGERKTKKNRGFKEQESLIVQEDKKKRCLKREK